MYIFIGCLVGLCLEMLHYREKNSHTSMAILMGRIFLSIVAAASSSVTFNNKKRTATVYTMMTILLLPVIVVIINQNPSIPLAYAVKDHKDNKADNNNQVAHLGGTQDKG